MSDKPPNLIWNHVMNETLKGNRLFFSITKLTAVRFPSHLVNFSSDTDIFKYYKWFDSISKRINGTLSKSQIQVNKFSVDSIGPDLCPP